MKKIISIFTLQNVMKVSACMFILLFALSTSFSSCANNSGKANDSTLVENQDSIVIDDTVEPIKEEPAVKGVELSWSCETNNWNFSLNGNVVLTLDYDTGDATMQYSIKDRRGDHDFGSQTFYYKGSWRSTSVRRGRNDLDAFDVHVSMTSWKGDEVISQYLHEKAWKEIFDLNFYFTDKFDILYTKWDDFNDGIAGGKIDKVKFITE